jgi:hypothetical protein
MNIDEQRKLGLKLAIQLNATKTIALLKDTNACYSEILKVAAEELGVDTVLNHILQGPDNWSRIAHLNFPELGNSHNAILAKSKEVASPVSSEKAPLFDQQIEAMTLAVAEPIAISKMNLNCQAIVVCNWSLNWTDAGEDQPMKNFPDWNSWLWTDNITQYKSSGAINLTKFSEHVNLPLNKGDQVWMWVYVQAGYDVHDKKLFSFVYDPGTTACANLVLSGTTSNPILSYQGVTY